MRDDPLAAARGIFNALLLSIAFWLLLTVAALAQAGQASNCSGTATGTAALVSFPKSGATGNPVPTRYVTIVNASASDTLWLNWLPGGTAAANTAGSIPLTSTGSSITWTAPYTVPGRISIITSGTSTPYSCYYQ